MKPSDALDLNRALLFLLCVGLLIAVWIRNRSDPSPAPAPTKAPPGAEPVPAAIAPTNSNGDRSLASAGQAVHK